MSEKKYRIAAIGDSHTYSNNVTSENSWPSKLEKLLNIGVYNFGIGSYGIFTYHAIIKTLIQPDTQGIIIGLYIANDLVVGDSYCHIDTKNDPFWKREIELLHLKLPHCGNKPLNKKIRNIHDLKTWLLENTAFLNAIDILIIHRLKQNQVQQKDTNKYDYLSYDIEQIAQGRRNLHTRNIYLSNPKIAAMYDNLQKFIENWSTWSQNNKIKLGVMFIPSKERVVYEYYYKNNWLDSSDPDFIDSAKKQITLEENISNLLDKHNIPHKYALEETLKAFQKAINKNNEFYPPGNGHPYEEGYQAYARTAFELWNDMIQQSN